MWQKKSKDFNIIYNTVHSDRHWFLLAEISILLFSAWLLPPLQPWPFPSQFWKTFFNSIKCISRLKCLTINSQPDRESDQTCSNKYDLTVDTFNSFSGSFPLFSKAYCMLATGICLSMSDYADRFRLGGIVAWSIPWLGSTWGRQVSGGPTGPMWAEVHH